MTATRGMGRRGVLAMSAAALAGCQQPGQPGASGGSPRDAVPRLGPNRTGYIAIQAPIVNRLRDLFIADVGKLLEQGAAEIYVLLASPGGSVSAAQDMIAFMDRTHAERGVIFTTHNTGVVASAACYVFLAGQRRLSAPRGTFLFHEAALVADGPITSLRLREASARMQQIERSFLAMLTAKTRLKEAEAASFIHRTVILNAEEARRDGIVEAVSGFALPPGATIVQIQAVSNAPGGTGPARRPEPGA